MCDQWWLTRLTPINDLQKIYLGTIMKLTRELFRAIIFYNFRRGL